MMTEEAKTKPTIIVAALDWGLGHATRMVPIIQYLQRQPCVLVLASSGSALQFWKKEFPNEKFLELPAYRPYYPKNFSLNWSMIFQAPRFFWTIFREYLLLKQWVKQGKVAAVISDNRYGFFSEKIPCVFVTHQLNIQTPKYLSGLSYLLKKINFFFIKKFRFCWVPDFEDKNNSLGKALSHVQMVPFPIRYIGWLSQFKTQLGIAQHEKILILLSGPEPQRSVLENILLKDLEKVAAEFLLIRGNLNLPPIKNPPKNLKYENLLSGGALQNSIEQAKWVICRSGYSTLMDLLLLQKKALLIATPGQTEQLYLADEVPFQFPQFYVVAQSAFHWKNDYLSKMESLSSQKKIEHSQTFHAAMDEFLEVVFETAMLT